MYFTVEYFTVDYFTVEYFTVQYFTVEFISRFKLPAFLHCIILILSFNRQKVCAAISCCLGDADSRGVHVLGDSRPIGTEKSWRMARALSSETLVLTFAST